VDIQDCVRDLSGCTIDTS